MKKEKLYRIEDQLSHTIEEINEFIFEHPELGNEEYECSSYLVEILKQYGFQVTYPYCDMDTAFHAELRTGEGPTIAFLAEYDALPGYGENKCENAHTCGHNWISATTVGAALSLSLMKEDWKGRIVVIGTPAEETVGGKCDLVERGAFLDVDAVIQMHLGAENNINVVTLAMDSLEFEFFGKAAHAAAYPEKGVNALDGVQLMFAGVNALRQHIQSDARIAGIISSGGKACNTVPDYASCKFYIRARHRDYLNQLLKRVIDCAKGAALMCGAEMKYHKFENSYDELKYHEGLRSILKENLIDLGITNFIDDDSNASGSSDIGNVSQVCPCVYCEIDTTAQPKVYAHHETFLPYVHGEFAKKTLHIATKAMAYTALQVITNPKILY